MCDVRAPEVECVDDGRDDRESEDTDSEDAAAPPTWLLDTQKKILTT